MEQSENSDGTAGYSAQAQYLKKSKAIEDRRIAKLGPIFGKLANLYFGDSKNAAAWKKGAIGEFHVGKVLDSLCDKQEFKVLHDRKIPKSVANIDHILITDRGVFVIDAKNYTGMVSIKQEGGLMTPLIETLYVGKRKQTGLVNGVKKQVSIVEKSLDTHDANVPVFGLLAFYGAEWPLFFKPKMIDGVIINSKGVEVAILERVIDPSIDVSKLFLMLQKTFPAK